jgi:hypothetical protein
MLGEFHKVFKSRWRTNEENVIYVTNINHCW